MVESRVELYFLRHGKKAKPFPEQEDKEVLLTPEGAREAIAAHSRYNLGKQWLVKGSPKDRSRQTPGLIVGGPIFTGNEKLSVIADTLNRGRKTKEKKYGSRIATDSRLDFDYKTPRYKAEADKAYLDNRTVEFLVNESDALAEELKDTQSTTYSRSAANIASIVLDGVSASKAFHKLVSKAKEQAQEPMRRIMGSHAGVLESFLLKVAEKVGGTSEKNKMMTAIGKGGFQPLEGFNVSIVRKGAKGLKRNPTITVSYASRDAGENGKPVYYFKRKIRLQHLLEIAKEGGL